MWIFILSLTNCIYVSIKMFCNTMTERERERETEKERERERVRERERARERASKRESEQERERARERERASKRERERDSGELCITGCYNAHNTSANILANLYIVFTCTHSN